MRNRLGRVCAALVAVGLLAAACGDDGGGGDNEASAEAVAATSTTEAAVTTTAAPGEDAFAQGDVQITLSWEVNGDLDLWATGPVEGSNAELVGVGRENAGPPGGQYVPVAPEAGGNDFLGDSPGPSCGESGSAMERVFWPAGEALSGDYSTWVEASDFETVEDCGAPIPYTLEVQVRGELVDSLSGEVSFGEISEDRIQFQVP